MRKAIVLQHSQLLANGAPAFDVTFDLEDGAKVGREEELLHTAMQLLRDSDNAFNRVGVRVHQPTSKWFESELETLGYECGHQIAYITIPKVTQLTDINRAEDALSRGLQRAGTIRKIPVHVLMETPLAFDIAVDIAAHPQVETLDFGLMDFISELGGVIPAACMRSPGQFQHQLIREVKGRLVMAAAANKKIASHNVTVDVRNPEQAFHDAQQARFEFGFLRMWSIHPTQIDPIIRAFTPSPAEIEEAHKILDAAQATSWGPIEYEGFLHDRASYRYYWGLLQRQRGV